MNSSALFCAGCAAAALLMAPAAKADPETHDGFFLRLGLNLGPAWVTETVERDGVEQPGEGEVSGFTSGFDLMLGGTPVPGLVIGGAFVSTYATNPTVKVGNIEGEADGTMITGAFALFVQYYFDPTAGFHLQGLVGFGAIDFVDAEGRSGGDDPTGVIYGFGAGYDFWVSDEWSIGPFARVLLGNFSLESGPIAYTDTYLYPSIGAAFTLH